MKTIAWLSLLACIAGLLLSLSACTTGFAVSKDGSILGPTSLLGQQTIGHYRLTGPNGVVVEMDNYATRNPDPDLVKAVVRYFTIDGAVKMLREGFAYMKQLSSDKIGLFKAGTDRQIGLVTANSAADVAKLNAAAAAAAAAKATPAP